MPQNARNTKNFKRILYADVSKPITLLKRDDDQLEGTVTAHRLYGTHRSRMMKTGQPIQRDMSSDHSCTWHIPLIELKRVGVHYINALDRFVEDDGKYWQPESGQTLDIKLFDNMLDIPCLRVDPPKVAS